MRVSSKNMKNEYNFSEAFVLNNMSNLVCLEKEYDYDLDIDHGLPILHGML